MTAGDEQLIVKAQSGDRQAFDELVSRHRSRIYYLALSMLGSRDTAMDIAQDAFVQAYLSLRTLRSPQKFGAWLMTIARNLCLMHLRRSREVTAPDLESATWEEPESDIMPFLDGLPEGTRSAALLYFVEEMKQSEIAETLGISLPAVKSRIRDARVRLQKEMIDMVRKSAPGDEFNKSLEHKLELARWYREIADMFGCGIPVLQVFEMLAQGDFSKPIREASAGIGEALKSGKTISQTIEELPALQTPQAVGMIRAGEVGGIVDWTMRFLADWIEVENSQRELELAFWCRTLGCILMAGVPLDMAFGTSLGILRTQSLKDAAEDIVRSLRTDRSLEKALARHSQVLLPVVEVALLAGRKSNTLGFALQWAANAVHARMARRLFGREDGAHSINSRSTSLLPPLCLARSVST